MAALETFFRIPQVQVQPDDRDAVIAAALAALDASPSRYPLADRISDFGPVANTQVAELMDRTQSAETRILAALILMHNGSRHGVPVLLREITGEGSYFIMASNALAKSKITEHVPGLLSCLRRHSPSRLREYPNAEDDHALTLLDILERLEAGLPKDIKLKYFSDEAPLYFQQAAKGFLVLRHSG